VPIPPPVDVEVMTYMGMGREMFHS